MLSKKKTLVFILLAIAILAAVNGHSVQKRFTCDILGSGMACGAHCLLIGKSGGYCDAGTCYCLNSGAKGGRR